jgi:hypothetical protein
MPTTGFSVVNGYATTALRAGAAANARSSVLFPAFGASTCQRWRHLRGASARAEGSRARPRNPRVTNLGDGFVVDGKCGFPYPAAPPDATNVGGALRVAARAALWARTKPMSLVACGRGAGRGGRRRADVLRHASRSARKRSTLRLAVLPPALPALFSVEPRAGLFFGFPLVLRASRSAGCSGTS